MVCTTFFKKEEKTENDENIVKKKRINPNAEEKSKGKLDKKV